MESSQSSVQITSSFLINCFKSERKRKENTDEEFEIISFNISPGTQPGDNYLSVIYTIDVELKLKEGVMKNRKLFIKCYPHGSGRQQLPNRSNMFFKELMVYNRWIPELYRMQREVLGLKEEHVIKLPYAPFVHGECIDFFSEEGKAHASRELIDPLENFIMMEDVRNYGFRMTDRRQPLDLAHVTLVVTNLAKVHALSWAYRQKVEEDLLGLFPCFRFNPSMDNWIGLMRGIYSQNIRSLDHQLGPGNELSLATLRYNDDILPAVLKGFVGATDFSAFDELLRIKLDPKLYGRSENIQEIPWRIICHGDIWSNNILFQYNSKGDPIDLILVDLQLPHESCVINDLQYVIYASTEAELRRNELPTLLRNYHDEFIRVCGILGVEPLPGFTLNELKYRFDRAKLFGFFMASMAFPSMFKEEEDAVLEDTLDVFSDFQKGIKHDNELYAKRVLELTREMVDAGVI